MIGFQDLHDQAGPASSTWYWIATAIFVAAFITIISEKVHKTKAALFGAALMIVLPILSGFRLFGWAFDLATSIRDLTIQLLGG